MTKDTIDLQIEKIISLVGENINLETLTPLQQVIFIIAEAETYCDMSGDIQQLIQRYGNHSLILLANAYQEINAVEIATVLYQIIDNNYVNCDVFFNLVSDMIQDRYGYDCDNIRHYFSSTLLHDE